MNSRERVLCAVSHKEGDRVPITFDAEPQVYEKLYRHFNIKTKRELWDLLNVDTWFVHPESGSDTIKELNNGETEDAWGIRRRKVSFGQGDSAGEYSDVVYNPLSSDITETDIANFNWPSYDMSDFSAVKEQCEEHDQFAIIGAATLGVFLKTSFLRGMDKLLMDLMIEQDRAWLLIDKVQSYVIHQVRELMKAAGDVIDIYYIADDFCMQEAPMLPPSVFEQFFIPYIKEIADIIHEYDCKFLFHCCGAVRPLLPMMIKAGVDMLEPIQTRAAGMEVNGLKRDFGNDLCFYGSVDLQNVLVKGTKDDVKNEVVRNLNALGRDGGFIIGPGHTYIQPDAPLDNILTMYTAAAEQGKYPLTDFS